MSEPELLTDLREGILWLVINRPQKANSLTLEMQVHMAEALGRASSDQDVKAVILTASGTKTFCAGADLKEKLDSSHVERRVRQMYECCLAIVSFPKPIIAAVNGHACGSGCIFALLCDACIAVEEATFSLPEIRTGRPTFLGMSLLSRLCGDLTARDLVLSGRRMPAAEALQRQLVTGLFSTEALHQEAFRIASNLAEYPPPAYTTNKQWLYRKYRGLIEEAAAASAMARATAR